MEFSENYGVLEEMLVKCALIWDHFFRGCANWAIAGYETHMHIPHTHAHTHFLLSSAVNKGDFSNPACDASVYAVL